MDDSGEAAMSVGAVGTGRPRHRARRTVTAVDLTLKAPIATVSALFDRRPFTDGSFEVEGLRLHYEDYGTGSHILVFLHGILLDAQMNRRLASDLAAAGNRVVLLDLPGHGQSDKPRHASAHRIDSYAHYVVALLDHLGIDQAIIGGVSLGANVTLQVAAQAPERVRGMLIEMPVLEWAVPGAALVFLPMLLGVHYAAPLVRAVAWLARRVPRTRIGAFDSFVTTLTLDPEESAAVLHGMLTGPITPTYEERHEMAMPALVIGHKIDFIHPFTDADHLSRQLPNARLAVARSIIELRVAPERLTTQIAAFLDEVWGHAPFHLMAGPRALPSEA
ncbi:MAG TPA: alpha/beta hydrolase [Acidimicrobiales bacterium]|nr:alpha/beta hydrolase [Acidimicrobiales bacterium]